ncbi:hypothetical protein CDAR_217181 [Caerostris darwini]|uniref:Uncharacterized protein n=1 Tax=Caerostris darwini TaxID=1538125 RepID=A0AAV4UV92_9ARAC|nr:hypothetical protein CDAR_217181 [Caerostris darwini]
MVQKAESIVGEREDEIRTCYLSHPGHRNGDYPRGRRRREPGDSSRKPSRLENKPILTLGCSPPLLPSTGGYSSALTYLLIG